ncbi:hypothetical protein H072_7717 [Dactylellina haptotyla CBS 200.50]|uniref:Uncharacterized protein n=1 Tax=Dactylellina haptotyla (strain CBS 200.50) TaxID=1284197 RepID=S8BGY2_DACHA|nr:hypothetical protein H072_7717 [Dactylellina haptotyla CBS 200.50]
MEQDPHILILVHNTATTNTKADAQYREQALAHLQFVGTRLALSDIPKSAEGVAEGAYFSQKRPLATSSSDYDEHNDRRKRASLVNQEPVVQVESSPVYIPMSSFEGLSQSPLAYSISTAVVRSTAHEPSTFVCEPLPNVPSQHAFTLEPVTPQLPNVSRVPETIFRQESQTSPFALKGTPEVPSISIVPETVLRPAGSNHLPILEWLSPIEYDDSPLEIPDSQPTPQRKLFPNSSGRTAASDPTDDSTITHVSQSPPAGASKYSSQQQTSFQEQNSQKEPRTPTGSPAVAVVNDTTIASIIEVSPLVPTPNPVTPNARRVLQVHPPPPKFTSLSPVSPLEHYSLPETSTSPDRLPQRFPLFTGQPVSPRSLLAFILEKELDSVDRQAIKADKKQVNRYLELRQLSEYNITSPAPGVNSNPKQITPMMEKLYKQAKLDKYFKPKLFARDMRRRERGYWRIDLSRWPRPKRPNENGGFKSTAEKKHGFWTRLAGYVKDGKLGETRLFFESESEGAGENVGDILRLYCWGEVAIHIWVTLYAISDRIVSELALRWVDSGGHAVIEM